MLEESENFFFSKQKDIKKITEFRDLKEKLYLIDYQEKQIYLFTEKIQKDSIKISIIEFLFDNKDKVSPQTSRFYTMTRKFSEFIQESIFSVYHSIDEIMKILNELISNGKFIIYDEAIDGNFSTGNNTSSIIKDSYIYINEINNLKNNNKNSSENRENLESNLKDYRKDSLLKENKNETEIDIPFISLNKNFNNNQNKCNNVKIFFRLALLNRILISQIKLEYKETSLSKAFDSNFSNTNVKTYGILENYNLSPSNIKKGNILNDDFINIQNNNVLFLTYIMYIIKILRNKSFEKISFVQRKGEKERLSVNSVGNRNNTFSSNNNFIKEKIKYEDSEGEDLDKDNNRKNDSTFFNTNTESNPINKLNNSKNIKILKKLNKIHHANEINIHDFYIKNNYGEKNISPTGEINIKIFTLIHIRNYPI